MSTTGDGGRMDPGGQLPQAPTGRMRAVLAALAADRDAEDGGHYRALCAAGVEVLPIRGSSLSLMTPAGTRTLLASSDERSERVADLQFTTGEGPAPDAFQTGAPVLEPVLDEAIAARWPGFAPAALEIGVRSIFAFPLQVGAIRLGTLCLDGDRPGLLPPADLGNAIALAEAAVASILNHLGNAPSQDGWAQEVGGYMSAVHYATGMIMVQLETTAENALLRLRGHAFGSGQSIAAVSADVVARRLSFGDVE